MTRFYLTTAIDYANGDPHMGHAFEKVGADAIARYRRLRGDEVRFVIGMDEHGQGVLQEAERQGRPPQDWVDEVAGRFAAVWERLEVSHDDFIRTTEPRHGRAVRALIERIAAAGDIYTARYEGYYCSRCEAFRKEAELEDGRCPFHPSREIVWTEEENFFFRLSKYRDPLLAHIREHPGFIQPESRRNEILRLLEGGLEDISASRSRVPWGVPFPGDPDHTVYVWFDALPNYISAIGFPDPVHHTWWPAALHVIGKDITRFHCVIWPAMLMSAGLPLPGTVWAHGFLMIGGGKLSKSEARKLDLDALVDRHGPDAFRYFLLRETPWTGDRDFASAEAFLAQFDVRYEADLANDLGNLLNRTVSMLRRYRAGEVPRGATTSLDRDGDEALDAYTVAMDSFRLHEGIDAAMQIVRRGNAFVDAEQPWRLAKDPDAGDRLDAVLAALHRALARTAIALAPFMPGKALEIWHRLGGEGDLPAFGDLDARLPARLSPAREGVLFPRPETP
ncbi:MAG: methionine--tRNA ligase [Gemmatimonadota bacterium]|nr:methionine--tRNA ligase [Gemmatimonadota bacterium]